MPTNDLGLPIALRKEGDLLLKIHFQAFWHILECFSVSEIYYANWWREYSKIRSRSLKDPKWSKAVHDKMRVLIGNGTWDVVDFLENKKIVGCNWVFIIKYKFNGSIEQCKASLVAQSFYTNLWDWLWRDLCTNIKVEFYQDIIVYCSQSWLGPYPMDIKKFLNRRDQSSLHIIHTTRRHFNQNRAKAGLWMFFGLYWLCFILFFIFVSVFLFVQILTTFRF